MAAGRSKIPRTAPQRHATNQRRERISFASLFQQANRSAELQLNRRGNLRQRQSVLAVIAEMDQTFDAPESIDLFKRSFRWLIALILLPFCYITTWTLFSQLFHATLAQGLWQAAEFWYFAVGGMLMVGWFASGLLRKQFLFLYVLGHELTHVVFVKLCMGRVMDIHVSTEGGYITTNKSNLLISLSPYFVPFWTVVFALAYALAKHWAGFGDRWDTLLYGMLGVTWMFHLVWTLWMIPGEQPDLKDNGTLLSLAVIYLANLLVVSLLLCLASESPLDRAADFGQEWIRVAAMAADASWRYGNQSLEQLMEFLRF
ncbi:MAG: hypothetical protein EAZ42_08900 [Verrucomicrobia bacterium]|nr:MAG: hypothetical protein EAZ42_08900 [Verrucomicrobiota bacterium]